REHGEPAVNGLVNMLMWVFVIVGIVLLVFWIASELMKKAEDPAAADAKSPEEADAETKAIIDKPLGDADELAAQGKFAEAIHTLLLRTLHELARSASVRVERSPTSRETLA